MSENQHLLHRQVNPSWIQNGRMTSQAFSPTPKDSSLLSVYDGSMISADASFHHFTAIQKLSSAGTVSVDITEVINVGLSWRLDPAPFLEHAVIDFSLIETAAKIKAKAQTLAELARTRGWTYLP
jgi:hypothetical protein